MNTTLKCSDDITLSSNDYMSNKHQNWTQARSGVKKRASSLTVVTWRAGAINFEHSLTYICTKKIMSTNVWLSRKIWQKQKEYERPRSLIGTHSAIVAAISHLGVADVINTNTHILLYMHLLSICGFLLCVFIYVCECVWVNSFLAWE